MRVYKEMAEDLRNWPAGSYAHGEQRGAGSTGRSSRRRVRDCVVGMSGGHANMPLPCVQLKTGDRSRVGAVCEQSGVWFAAGSTPLAAHGGEGSFLASVLSFFFLI